MSATVVQGGGDLDTLSPQRIRITEPRKVCPAFYNPLVKVHANICPFPPWYKGEIGNPLPKRPRIIQLRKVYASFYNTPAEIHANSCPPSGSRFLNQGQYPVYPCGRSTCKLMSPPWYKGEGLCTQAICICNDTEDENGRGSPSVGPKSNEYK